MCILMFVSSLFYPLVFLQIIETISEKVPNAVSEIANLKDQTLKLVTLWQLAFTAFTFICCILFTHKIAGPIYKTRRFLESIRNGHFGADLYFRNGDYLHELADDVNLTMKALQNRFKEDSIYLNEASTYLNNIKMIVPDDKKVVIDEIIEKLKYVEESFTEVAVDE